MTTDDIRTQKALALPEWHEAREEFRRRDAELRSWQSTAADATKKLFQLLTEKDPDWQRVKGQTRHADFSKMERLLSDKRESEHDLRSTQQKLEAFRLSFDTD